MAGGNAVKIGIIVVALGVAVFFFVRGDKELKPELADGATGIRNCLCTQCEHQWDVMEAEWKALMQAAPEPPPPPTTDGIKSRRSPQPIKMVQCPQCSEFAAVLAEKCPDSDTWYPVRNPDGTRGRCPD